MMNIFKVQYIWYEGDCGECFLGKEIDKKDFEKDLVKARDFAEGLIGTKARGYKYLGKGYTVECLPEFFEQIRWFLIEKKGYAECCIQNDTPYFIDDDQTGKIGIQKREERTEWVPI